MKWQKVFLIFLIIVGLMTGGNYFYNQKGGYGFATIKGESAEVHKDNNDSDNKNNTAEEAKVIYPRFSYIKYQKERDMILEDIKDSIEEINKLDYTIKEVAIPIALHDINGDGVEDIIAGLQHPYFSGYKNTCSVVIYMYDDNKENITFFITLTLANLIIDEETGEQDNFSIINVEGEKWDEFLVNGVSWKWNGEEYI